MQLILALSKLKNLKQPVLSTNDVAACLDISNVHASKILARLVQAEHLCKITRGLWGFPERIDPLVLPDFLTRPDPSYVSLQTALYFRGYQLHTENLPINDLWAF